MLDPATTMIEAVSAAARCAQAVIDQALSRREAVNDRRIVRRGNVISLNPRPITATLCVIIVHSLVNRWALARSSSSLPRPRRSLAANAVVGVALVRRASRRWRGACLVARSSPRSPSSRARHPV